MAAPAFAGATIIGNDRFPPQIRHRPQIGLSYIIPLCQPLSGSSTWRIKKAVPVRLAGATGAMRPATLHLQNEGRNRLNFPEL